jgi:polygalacturonase
MMYWNILFQQMLLLLLLTAGSPLAAAATFTINDAQNCCQSNDNDATTIETIIDVTQHGVVGDGIHDDTESMRRLLLPSNHRSTLDDSLIPFSFSCCCCHRRKIVIPAHITVLSYPLNLTSCTTFQVDGTLLAMPSTEHWPILPPVATYGSSEDTFHGGFTINQYHPFVYAANASHIRITGNGNIHGNGEYWWDLFQNNSTPLQLAGRPNLIQTVHCNNVEIDSVTLINSAFWTVHPMLSRNIHIHHMTLRAPMYAPNVDGIDPDSCENVLIEYNDIACGDDHIAIKAGLCGMPDDHRSINHCTDPHWPSVPTRNVTVQHNIFRTGMGIAIGSESSGSIQDVYIFNNSIGVCQTGHDDPHKSCGWGPALHLKTTITRSGSIQNVTFDRNMVYNTSMFILVETNYHGENQPQLPANYPKTIVQTIVFSNNVALGTATAAIFHCDAQDPCHEIHVINNTIVNVEDETTNPWGCQYIQSYHVQGNRPGGLEECMERSMNGTRGVTRWERRSKGSSKNDVAMLRPPKELWWKHYAKGGAATALE